MDEETDSLTGINSKEQYLPLFFKATILPDKQLDSFSLPYNKIFA